MEQGNVDMVGTHLGSEFGVRGLGVQRLRSLGAKEFRVEGLFKCSSFGVFRTYVKRFILGVVCNLSGLG